MCPRFPPATTPFPFSEGEGVTPSASSVGLGCAVLFAGRSHARACASTLKSYQRNRKNQRYQRSVVRVRSVAPTPTVPQRTKHRAAPL